MQDGRECSGALQEAKPALASEQARLVRAPALFADGLNRLACVLRLHARRLHCHLCTSRHLQRQSAEAAGHDDVHRAGRILNGRCRRAIRVQQQRPARARPKGRRCARGPVEQQRSAIDGSVRDRTESNERPSREGGSAAPQQRGTPTSQRQHAAEEDEGVRNGQWKRITHPYEVRTEHMVHIEADNRSVNYSLNVEPTRHTHTRNTRPVEYHPAPPTRRKAPGSEAQLRSSAPSQLPSIYYPST